ncbi:hypothetical protein GF356_04750 [candidate division GN15 bacterium]|nr:hypothetical protein [candidate division GN15 bacterium]
MSSSRVHTFLLLLAVITLSLTGVAHAQTGLPADTVRTLPGIQIETGVSQAEMYVGDRITYTVAITYDSTYELIPPPLGANLGAFDVKDYNPDSTATLDDGRVRNITSFELSTFTTGEYVIPPVPVAFTLPDLTTKVVMSEPVPITVKSLILSDSDSLDIRSLKDPYEFERNYASYYLWGGIALALVLTALGFWWWWRKRRLTPTAPEDTRMPWEIAFERLAMLKQEGLPTAADNGFKPYYFELTDIAREYLGRIYDRNVLDMTTEEFLAAFDNDMLPDDLHDRCRDFFRHADLVKFARMEPEDHRISEDFDFVYKMVDEVRIDYQRREAEKAAAEAAARAAGKKAPSDTSTVESEEVTK